MAKDPKAAELSPVQLPSSDPPTVRFFGELVSIDYIAPRIDRPTPWIAARLKEMEADPIISLNEVVYYRLSVIEKLKEVSEEWAERIRAAKRDAMAAGV